jgi:hypothetical protein
MGTRVTATLVMNILTYFSPGDEGAFFNWL